MRRYTILTLFLFFTLGIMAQNITIRAVDRPAAEVFRSIMEQTDRNFIYSSDLLKDMKITISANKKPLKKVLDEIFHDSDIKYELKGKNVILKKKKNGESPKKKITPKKQAETKIQIPDSVRITMLEPVEVISQAENHPLETAKLGVSTLSAADISNTPALFGEPDLIKAVQMLPGVSESTAGIAGMNVHGGNSDENLYLLDNVPLYQVEHFAGLFSPFNTDIVKQSDFYRTSVPARYDGRLSSVLDVHLKNGNINGHHGSARLGLTAGAFNISGPIGGKTTYLVGLRRSWYDLISTPILAIVNSKRKDETTSFRYHFMDFNARVEHRFSEKTKAFISTYYGDDLLKVVTKEKSPTEASDYREEHSFNWGNFLLQGGVSQTFSQKLSAEFSVAYTKYFSRMGYDIFDITTEGTDTIKEQDILKSTNYIHSVSARADFCWDPGDNSRVRFGTSYSRQSFLPDRTYRENTFNDTTIYSKIPGKYMGANEVNAYIEDDWRISDKVHAEGGIHASLFNIDGKTKWGISPRLSFSYSPSSSWALKAAYSRTTQYVHKTEETYLSLPCDRWMPAIGNLKPMTADKIGIGGYWQTEGGDYAVTVEGYYKFMHNLIDFRDEYYLAVPASSWSSRLTSGKGTAKGIDIMIEKKTGKLTGHLSYSLAWSDRQFAERNGGRPYPARFDHRHTIKAFMNWDISDKVSINALWTGHSGNRFTLLPQRYEMPEFSNNSYNSFYDENIPLRAPINNYQLPFYHRLDLACNVKNRHGYWTFSLYNAYCNMNTISIDTGYSDSKYEWVEVKDGLWEYVYIPGKPVFQKLKLIPIIPSVSYTWIF